MTPPARRAAHGAVWMLGLRVTQRGFGLVRLLVLTQLLQPEHFGTLGIALLLVELLNACSQTGFETALIQRRGDVAGWLDTAWTAAVARGAFLCALLALAAPLAAAAFGLPEATPLIRVVGLAILVQSFTNVGVVLLERELDFRRFAVHHGIGSVADLAVAIAAALVFANAWALVAGMLAGDLARLVTSYWIHDHRPRLRFDWRRARELFAFGKWMLLSNAFLFLAHHGDDAVVAALLGPAALGLYQLAYQLSHVAILELSRAVSRVALPSYARLQDDLAAVRRTFLRALQGSALLAWPVAALVFSLAHDFTRIALPARWAPIAPVVQVLALHAAVRACGAALGPVLLALGRARALSGLTLVKCAALGLLIVPLVQAAGILGAACAALAAALVSNLGAQRQVSRALGCGPRDLAASLAAPLAASLGMAGFLAGLRGVAPIGGPLGLGLHAAAGLAVYALGALLLGRLGPQPLSQWAGFAAAGLAPWRAPQGGDA